MSFALGPEDFELLDQNMRWRVVPGVFDLMIGSSSREILTKATLEVKSSDFDRVAANRDH